jgi:high affinity Mn2+ porin
VPPVAVPAADPWAGFYVGGHVGYAAGSSQWSATPAGAAAPIAGGSLDLFQGFDAFKGTGSYFSGLQAGYNAVFPSRLLVGLEADISFPSSVTGTQIVSTPGSGLAAYTELMQFAGTVRARVGYAPGHWLYYATGGFAWSYDELRRTQLAGPPPAGAVDTVETRVMVPRLGYAVGAGVEVALSSSWTARAEYLATVFGQHGAAFPDSGERFNSDQVLHSVRLGMNYRPGAGAASNPFGYAPSAFESDRFALHAQSTYVSQYAFPFHEPYRGPNSLPSNQGRETWDVTFFLGAKLWSGAELWINPEIDQGFGLGGTFGVAGFPSGEAYKVGESVPYTRLQRAFIRQTINLGGESQKVEAGANQFSGSQTADRLVFTVGKFSVGDIFDTNKYAHDPRADFLNWSIIDTGTFDYAADAWAYTYGAAVEWYRDRWALRTGLFDMSIAPNTTQLDPDFSQFQWLLELEHRHELWGQPGKIAVTGYLTRGRLGRYTDAVALAQLTGSPADIAAVRRYTTRSGASLNVEQQLSADLGMFVRAGLASPGVEPYEFTDIDRTVAAGLVVSGKQWGRPDDSVGIAGVVNAISGDHKAFLNAGGLGILVGDGQLPNPGAEKIIEVYYSFPLWLWRATLDYQYIQNPAYNRDRGPVNVIGTRIHAQF